MVTNNRSQFFIECSPGGRPLLQRIASHCGMDKLSKVMAGLVTVLLLSSAPNAFAQHHVTLSFDRPANPPSNWVWRIYKSKTSGTYQLSANATIAATATCSNNSARLCWTDTNVVGGKTYFYIVRAYDRKTKAESAPAPEAQVVIPQP